jgi:hypothetical protein
MIFARVRELLTKNRLPPGTTELLASVKDTGELLRGLDELVTRNEVAVTELNEELAALEELERQQKEKIRSGSLGRRTRASVLRRILRLRQQMDHTEDRLKIHDRNIRLHLDLIGTLKQIDAMAMAGVGEREVDGIILRFGEELKSYQASLTSGEVLDRMEKAEQLPGEEDLSTLEAEILGEDRTEPAAEDDRDAAKARPGVREEPSEAKTPREAAPEEQ